MKLREQCNFSKNITNLVSTALVGSALAASVLPASANTLQCPNLAPLKNMCFAVSERMLDKDKRNEYMYQTLIFEAACVDPRRDTDRVIAERVRAVWLLAEDSMVCNSSQFDVKNGNILKYAVASNFDQFIYDVTAWGVNLNKVDVSDGETVLDYIRYHLRVNRGNPPEQQFQILYDELRGGGAKHCEELKQTTGRQALRCGGKVAH